MRTEKKSYNQHREWPVSTLRRLGIAMTIFYFSCLSFLDISAQTSLVEVYAGEDTQVCGSGFNLDELDAYIRGINDGEWSTSGTGYFVSTGNQTERFSASSTYIPSRLDINLGFFILRLTADDRNANDQRDPPYDEIRVDIIESSTMVCRSHLNLNHDQSCAQVINPSLYLINQPYPDAYYTVELFTEDGEYIDSNIVASIHVGMTLNVKIILNCNGNSCWGKLTVEDKNPPPIFCKDVTVSCYDESLPDSIGFPILDFGFDTIRYVNDVYHIEGLDNCSNAILEYVDITQDNGCVDNVIEVIHRSWTAVDDFGNKSTCEQEIHIQNAALSSLVLPLHFDGDSIPPFMCSDSFPMTDLGHPSPDITGYPLFAQCSNLQAVFSDYVLPLCGGSYKVLREWTIVDWCTGINLIHNQNIHIVDTLAPIAICVDDMVFATDSHTCQSRLEVLELLETVDNCSDFVTSLIVTDTHSEQTYSTSLSADNQSIDIHPLPIGTYSGRLTIIDECGNRSECSFGIRVEDQSPPVAVCDRNTQVGLQEDGLTQLRATSIDDGSVDNCTITRFGVVRASDTCAQVDTFADYVMFCCEDVGEVQDITFRVWDENGNYNDCAVQVSIVDNTVPKLYCPNDITVDCNAPIDLDDLSAFGVIRQDIEDVDSLFIFVNGQSTFVGLDGLVKDNCGVLDIQEEVDVNISCSEGYIDRMFVVGDHTGQSRSCHQRIHIVNSDPFIRSNITWPDNIVMTDCTLDEFSTEDSGEPTFIGDECGMVVSTYKDLQLDVVANSCFTILREWSVIDWCQYDEISSSGFWTHFQEIRIENRVAPTINHSCRDTVVCIANDQCSAIFDFAGLVSDDCSTDLDLTWQWAIDMNDGTQIQGVDHLVDEELPLGSHTIIWRVNDGCGNTSDPCQYNVIVQDCKPPTVYCHSIIATSFMETTGMVSISADQFNISSTDNCTVDNDLKFSFGRDTLHKNQVFTCSEIGDGISHTFDVEVWVTDEAGNQDFCQVTVEVRDRGDFCEDRTHANLQGTIYNPSGSTMTVGTIQVHGVSTDRYAYFDIHDASYFFSSLPVNESYNIDYQHDLSIQSGLSVVDLVMVQNHILQLSPFTDPYQYHAADVNGSKSISATDLVILRKVILGITDEFSGQDQWQEFSMSQDGTSDHVWSMENEIESVNLSAQSQLDMVVVKTGDVNFSNTTYAPDSEGRSTGPIVKIDALPSGDGDIVISLTEEQALLGFQFDLALLGEYTSDDLIFASDSQITDEHYSVAYDPNNNVTTFRFCWNDKDGSPRLITSIMKVRMAHKIANDDFEVSNGIYITDSEIGGVIRGKVISENILNPQLSVNPNPVIDDIHIYIQGVDLPGVVSIINHFGETVYTMNIAPNTEPHQIQIEKKYCQLPGIYYVKYSANTASIVASFVVL